MSFTGLPIQKKPEIYTTLKSLYESNSGNTANPVTVSRTYQAIKQLDQDNNNLIDSQSEKMKLLDLSMRLTLEIINAPDRVIEKSLRFSEFRIHPKFLELSFPQGLKYPTLANWAGSDSQLSFAELYYGIQSFELNAPATNYPKVTSGLVGAGIGAAISLASLGFIKKWLPVALGSGAGGLFGAHNPWISISSFFDPAIERISKPNTWDFKQIDPNLAQPDSDYYHLFFSWQDLQARKNPSDPSVMTKIEDLWNKLKAYPSSYPEFDIFVQVTIFLSQQALAMGDPDQSLKFLKFLEPNAENIPPDFTYGFYDTLYQTFQKLERFEDGFNLAYNQFIQSKDPKIASIWHDRAYKIAESRLGCQSVPGFLHQINPSTNSENFRKDIWYELSKSKEYCRVSADGKSLYVLKQPPTKISQTVIFSDYEKKQISAALNINNEQFRNSIKIPLSAVPDRFRALIAPSGNNKIGLESTNLAPQSVIDILLKDEKTFSQPLTPYEQLFIFQLEVLNNSDFSDHISPLTKKLVEHGQLEAIRFFRDHGLLWNHTADNDGNTLLHLALQHHQIDIVNFFLQEGIDPHKLNNAGIPPLHMSFFADFSKGFQTLLSHETANIYIEDRNGRTIGYHLLEGNNSDSWIIEVNRYNYNWSNPVLVRQENYKLSGVDYVFNHSLEKIARSNYRQYFSLIYEARRFNANIFDDKDLHRIRLFISEDKPVDHSPKPEKQLPPIASQRLEPQPILVECQQPHTSGQTKPLTEEKRKEVRHLQLTREIFISEGMSSQTDSTDPKTSANPLVDLMATQLATHGFFQDTNSTNTFKSDLANILNGTKSDSEEKKGKRKDVMRDLQRFGHSLSIHTKHLNTLWSDNSDHSVNTLIAVILLKLLYRHGHFSSSPNLKWALKSMLSSATISIENLRVILESHTPKTLPPRFSLGSPKIQELFIEAALNKLQSKPNEALKQIPQDSIPASSSTHRVKKLENLWDISVFYKNNDPRYKDMSPTQITEAIKKASNLTSDTIYPGDILTLPF